MLGIEYWLCYILHEQSTHATNAFRFSFQISQNNFLFSVIYIKKDGAQGCRNTTFPAIDMYLILDSAR